MNSRRIAATLTALFAASLLAGCTTSASCGTCDDTGPHKPTPYTIEGSASCPQSVGFTRTALLDELDRAYIGRGSAPDQVVLRVDVHASNGNVVCEPAYPGIDNDFTAAALRTEVRIGLKSSDGALHGEVMGTARLSAEYLTKDVALRVKYLEVRVDDVDPAAIGYVPRSTGARIAIDAILVEDGTAYVNIVERTGTAVTSVLTFAP